MPASWPNSGWPADSEPPPRRPVADRRPPGRPGGGPCGRQPREWQCEGDSWEGLGSRGQGSGARDWKSLRTASGGLCLRACRRNRLDDFLQIVGHLHRPDWQRPRVRTPRLPSTSSNCLLRRACDRRPWRSGSLSSMAGEDANDALVGRDDALLDQQLLGAGHAGRAGRLAAQSAGADLGLGVEDLLVAHLADHAAAPLQGPQALVQVDRAIDFDGAGDRRGPAMLAASISREVALDAVAVSGRPSFQRRPRRSTRS